MHDKSTKLSLMDGDEALHFMKTSVDEGLSAETASSRLDLEGPNTLDEAQKEQIYLVFLRQFTDLTVLVLMVSAVISSFIGESSDTWAIVLIVILNAVLGFFHEVRAEKAMAALGRLTHTKASVLRDNQWQNLPSEVLVPGDIVSIEAGDKVPADVRILQAYSLEIDESTMTGESQPVTKTSNVMTQAYTLLADQKNLLFKGTSVNRGRAIGIVYATGMKTELGKIARLLSQNKRRITPLQIRLSVFGKRLAFIVLALCALLFLMGVYRGEPTLQILMIALSIAVAAIPESLPAVVTILLSLGARTMSKQNALVKKLPAVETLGSVTFICTDKTGTLTENRMKIDSLGVSDVVIPLGKFKLNDEQSRWLAKSLLLNNDARIVPGQSPMGDPTEIAMLDIGTKLGLSKETLDKEFPRISEVPFTSERMMMSTLHKVNDSEIIILKGAPEKVIPLCVNELRGDQSAIFEHKNTLRTAGQMAADGLRVMAFAMKTGFDHHKEKIDHNDEVNFTFIGLIGLLDPPRLGALKAIQDCKTASVNVVMITGDHPTTAKAIAKKLGMLDSNLSADQDAESVMTGAQLAKIDEQDLLKRVKAIRVYARTSPEQKIRIVKALQTSGEVVAMTGDGVNDAPALKCADIGVAMGKGGTEVAREAAHMILLDDNFATVVVAIKEGRRIFDNIRKFVRYVLTGNSGEIWALVLAPLFGMPLPLLPIQILFVNLLTDGLPGIALASEPADRHILSRPPRHPQESIFAHGLWQHALWIGLLLAFATLTAFHLGARTSHQHGQTMAFTVLTLGQLFHVAVIRSETDSIFSLGISGNKQLMAVVGLTALLQTITVYNPIMNALFRTHPISALEFTVCILLAAAVGAAVELEKMIRRLKSTSAINP